MNPDEHHVALPKLYGAPAYARPPRVFEVNERPPDPDDLPLEVFREAEDAGPGTPAPAPPAPGPSASGPWPLEGAARGDAAAATGPAGPSPSEASTPGDAPASVDPAEAVESDTSFDGAGTDAASEAVEIAADTGIPAPAGPFGVRALGRFIQRR